METLPMHLYPFNPEGPDSSIAQRYTSHLEHRQTVLLHSLYERLSIAGDRQAGTEHASRDLLDGQVLPKCAHLGPLVHLLESYQALKQQRLLAEETALALQHQGILQSRLSAFDGALATGEYIEAAKLSKDFRFATGHIQTAEGNELAHACQHRLHALEQALADNLAASVSLSYEPSPRLAVAASFSPQHVWGAMQTLGSLDQHLSGLIQHMLLILVQPLATCSHSARVTRFDEENTAIFQICSNDSNGDADVMNIVSASLTTCLQFLATHVFQDVTEQVGVLLWPEVAQLYISACLQPACSAHGTDLEALHILTTTAESFELEAAALGYCSQDRPVHAFCAQQRTAAVQQERMLVVSQAQAVIMAADYEAVDAGMALPLAQDASTGTSSSGVMQASASAAHCWGPEGNEAPVLATGRYKVSRGLQQLLALLDAALGRASNAALRMALVQAVADSALLQATLPSLVHARQLQVPHLAALYAMDCQHLADELLLMPHCHLAAFDSGTATQDSRCHVPFVGPAKQLRLAAEAALDNLVQQQAHELMELLEAANGFRHLHQAQAGIAARRTVQRCIHSLTRFGSVVSGVLAPKQHVLVASRLVGVLAQHISDAILSMQDIGSEESDDLARIIHPVLADAVPAVSKGARAADDAGALHDSIQAAVEVASPELLKLKELHAFLSARLADIQAKWRQGVLQSAGVTADEAGHMVKALFEDTDRRRSTLDQRQTRDLTL